MADADASHVKIKCPLQRDALLMFVAQKRTSKWRSIRQIFGFTFTPALRDRGIVRHNGSMDSKDILTLAIAGTAATVALATLIKAIIEYQRNATTKRLELFLTMRTRLRLDKEFVEICDLLEGDSEKLRSIPLVQKDRFTGFFEELAIMRNSGLLNEQVTLYMFGYWAIRCNRSRNFWDGLNRDQALWSLFFHFAEEMEVAQKSFRFQPTKYHLR